MIYIVYRASGKTEYIEEIRPITLEKMQEIVGGSIEFTPAFQNKDRDLHFCVNEEGRLIGLPINKVFPKFVGDVILGRLDREGEFVGVR